MPTGYGAHVLSYPLFMIPHVDPQKLVDSRGRRLPWTDPPAPTRSFFVFNEADDLMFEWLDRYLYLPSLYLVEVQSKVRTARTNLQVRLKEFCKGSKAQSKVLFGPKAQGQQAFARARHKVYGLTPFTEKYIERQERHSVIRPAVGSWFIHQLMQACVVASIELRAPLYDLTFRNRSQVLTSKHCPNQVMRIPNPSDKSKFIYPDDIFALAKPDPAGGEPLSRNFIVEVDRDTESMKGKAGATYFGVKIEHYFSLYRKGAFKSWWGFARPRILIVTVNERRARQTLAHIASLNEPGIAKYFYVAVVPEFDSDPDADIFWRVPGRIFDDLLAEPWMTTEGPKLITD